MTPILEFDDLDWPEQEPEDLDAYQDDDGAEALTAAERNPSLCAR